MFLSMLSSLALYCVGWEGLQTSLKPEEAFIYLYDGRMVGMSEIGSIQVMSSLRWACPSQKEGDGLQAYQAFVLLFA